MSLGHTYAALMAARFVTGLGVGLAVVVAPVFTAEVAPASVRGVLSSLVEVCINVGILLGYLSNELRLRRPGGAHWLGRHVRRRRSSPWGWWSPCRSRHGGSPCAGATPTRTLSSCAPRTPPPKPTSVSRRVDGAARSAVGYGAAGCCLRDRAPVLPGSVRHRGDRPVQPSHLQAYRHVVDHGRPRRHRRRRRRQDALHPLRRAPCGPPRPAPAPAALAAALWRDAATSPAACVAAVLFFVHTFSVGFGLLVPAYSVEVLQGTGLGTAVGRLTRRDHTKPACFVLYAGVAVVACVFVYVRLPETRGRSLEDMDALFAK
ncbi:hypothetical protein EJB05_26424, partial [Eragrostis curvula]